MNALKNWHLWMNLVLSITVLLWPSANAFLMAHPEISVMALGVVNALLGILTHGQVQLVDESAGVVDPAKKV